MNNFSLGSAETIWKQLSLFEKSDSDYRSWSLSLQHAGAVSHCGRLPALHLLITLALQCSFGSCSLFPQSSTVPQ